MSIYIYFNTAKNFRATLFFRASASCSKIFNAKSIFNAVKIFRASASCLKILYGEIMFNVVYSMYIHLGVIRLSWENGLFLGQIVIFRSKFSAPPPVKRLPIRL